MAMKISWLENEIADLEKLREYIGTLEFEVHYTDLLKQTCNDIIADLEDRREDSIVIPVTDEYQNCNTGGSECQTEPKFWVIDKKAGSLEMYCYNHLDTQLPQEKEVVRMEEVA